MTEDCATCAGISRSRLGRLVAAAVAGCNSLAARLMGARISGYQAVMAQREAAAVGGPGTGYYPSKSHRQRTQVGEGGRGRRGQGANEDGRARADVAVVSLAGRMGGVAAVGRRLTRQRNSAAQSGSRTAGPGGRWHGRRKQNGASAARSTTC